MRRQELCELFDYLIETRTRFLETFRQIGWEEFSRDRGATWGSMLGIFLHMLDDEEGWLQFAARGRSIIDGPDRKAGSYSTFEQVSEDQARVAAQTRAFLRQLTEEDFSKVVEFEWPGEVAHRPLEKIAMHAFIDELAHVGELICLLWQIDVKPPYIDWIDYHLS
jgi:uncharacterized damage-inducible protein DinB